MLPFLPLYALLRSFVARLALVPLQSVAIPVTVLSVDSLLLCHYKQIVVQPVHVSLPVLLFWARVQLVHHQLVGHSRSQLSKKVGLEVQAEREVVFEPSREVPPWRPIFLSFSCFFF